MGFAEPVGADGVAAELEVAELPIGEHPGRTREGAGRIEDRRHGSLPSSPDGWHAVGSHGGQQSHGAGARVDEQGAEFTRAQWTDLGAESAVEPRSRAGDRQKRGGAIGWSGEARAGFAAQAYADRAGAVGEALAKDQ